MSKDKGIPPKEAPRGSGPGGPISGGLVRSRSQAVVAGDTEAIGELTDDPVAAWTVPDGMTAAQVLDRYRAETERSDAIVASRSLDDPPAWWPDFFGDFRLDTVREVMLHVITETATHAGHLDAARELIDGRQWMVLD